MDCVKSRESVEDKSCRINKLMSRFKLALFESVISPSMKKEKSLLLRTIAISFTRKKKQTKKENSDYKSARKNLTSIKIQICTSKY